MAYKLGLMLSIVFVMSVMLLGGDIIGISSIHSSLDALALVVARSIGKEGKVSSSTYQLVKSHGAKILYDTLKTPAVGEKLTFTLYKNYQTFVISKDPLKITVKRTVIVGYYMN